MKKLKLVGLISIVMIFLIAKGNAQISASKIDKMVYEEMVRQEIPGLAVGVYQAGRINYTKGYGHKDINRTKPITNTTPMRWASISKPITAASALMLQEFGKININDKVDKHYKHWLSKVGSREVGDKSRKATITIRHLLQHRSGINHYTRGVADKANQYSNKSRSTYKTDWDKFNANSSVNIFREANLDFKPGDDYLYTTFGYNLLGAVVDKKQGSYTSFVDYNIKRKLGMTNLRVSNGSFKGFQKKTDGIINEKTDSSKEWVLPGGGWQSDVRDLLKFAKGIMSDNILRTTSQLWGSDKNQIYQGLESTGSGYDLRVWHGGSHSNLRTLMYVMPNRNIAVVVMIPAEYASTWNIVRRIVDKMGVNRNFSDSPKDTCTDNMGSSKKKFIGVWRKTNKKVIIRRGYTKSNFNKEWNFLKRQGYQVFDIEAYKHSNGNTVWDGVFKKAGSGYAMWRNYDYNGFKTKWDEMNSKGYRLYDLETYVDGGKRKWAGLFKKGSGKYAMWRNLSTTNFKTKITSMSSKGMKLIDVEVYSSRGQLKWSGVWVSGNGEFVKWGNTWGNFNKLIKTREKQGYKLTDTERYLENGSSKWVGIWEKTTQLQKRSEGKNYCNFMSDRHSIYSEEGYELIDLDVYN